MTCIQAYQQGLLDAIQERTPLLDLLKAAEESVLVQWYAYGQLVGSQLLLDEAIS